MKRGRNRRRVAEIAEIAGVFVRERGRGDNEEGRRRVFISEDSDGHGFVGIPSV